MRSVRYIFAVSALFLSLGNLPQAIAQNYKWVKGTTTNINTGKIAMDHDRNVVTSGTFTGAIDLDFSTAPSDTAMFYNGGSFIAKYNADGNFEWGQKLGNGLDSIVDIKSIQTDDSGNVYIAGHFTGAVDFNTSNAVGDTAIETSLDLGGFYPCIYIAKYNSNGQFVWVMNLGGTLPELWGMNIKNNKLYVTGGLTTYSDAPEAFRNLDFNPSKLLADTFYLTGAAGTTEFELNPFFAVYNLNGGLLLAKRINGTPSFKGFDIDADDAGNIYMAGNLMGTHDINASTNPADTFFLSGTQGVFLASYNEDGAFRWAAPVLTDDNYGTVFPENPILIKAVKGNIYVSGLFKSTADFDPGSGAGDILMLTASTGSNGSSYLGHYDTAGNFINAHTLQALGGTGDRIKALATDDSGHVYIAGEFNGTADFNFSTLTADTFNLKSAGTNIDPDIFFAKYNNTDDLVWARKVGNPESQFITGMAVTDKTLHIFGRFGGDVVFNPMPPLDISSRLMGGGTYLAAYRTSPPSSAKQLLTYAFATPAATGTITATDSVLLTVPAGTNVSGLVAGFTVSPLAIATVGTLQQVSGTTPNNFSNVVTYRIMAEDSSTRDYYVKVRVEEAPPTGINEAEQEGTAFKVWPNPADHKLNFSTAANVKLYDMGGKLVLSAVKVKSISVGQLPEGIYIIENEKGQKRKIIIH